MMDKLPIKGIEENDKDPEFIEQIKKMHRVTVYARWLFTGFLWLTVAPICLWMLRDEMGILQQYFTWNSVKFGLFYNPLATFGLAFCIGMTLAVLIWQSRNILFGLPKQEVQRLENQVFRIRKQGPSHPLWKFICQ